MSMLNNNINKCFDIAMDIFPDLESLSISEEKYVNFINGIPYSKVAIKRYLFDTIVIKVTESVGNRSTVDFVIELDGEEVILKGLYSFRHIILTVKDIINFKLSPEPNLTLVELIEEFNTGKSKLIESIISAHSVNNRKTRRINL